MEKRTGPAAALGTWALLAAATLLAYWPALRGGLVWDDDHHVTAAGLQSLHGLWRIWFDPGATQQYYPLLHSAFWLEHLLWGDAVLGYHLVNVILHVASACLVVAIARRLALPGAIFAGFLFALHPVFVESVAWITEQKTTLSAVFCLAAALAYLRFDQTRRSRDYLFATALFLCALLSKSVTATLPAALLVIFWWQREQKRGQTHFSKGAKNASVPFFPFFTDVRPLLPWFVLGIPMGIFTAWVERTSIGAEGADFALSLVQRCLLAGRAICFYAAKLVWPANLMFTYPRWTIDPGVWWQYLFPTAVCALFVGLCLMARRHRGPLAAFLIFAGTLFPVLGFLNVYPFLFSYVADHFQYLASLGILVPAAAGLTLAARRIPHSLSICAAMLLVSLLGALTWRQSQMYRDAETLYRATLERNPDSFMARNNLCALLTEKPGGVPEAIVQCEAALRIRPEYAEAHNNLGSALARVPGRMADALAHFRAALALKPQFADAHFNLANALARIPGNEGESVAEFQAALRLRPDYLETHMNLAAVLLRLPGRVPDAIAQYQAALGIDPTLARAHNNLGSLFSQLPGRLPDAITEYQAALRTNPAYADAHYNLALALAQAGRPADAIAQFESVLRIDPQSARAHYNLGLLLARAGHVPEAVVHLEAAQRIAPTPDLQRLLDGLKAAH